MENLKSILVADLLELTKDYDLPEIVEEEFNGDYKMFLYTLTTDQLVDSLENEDICNLDK